mmetsp:Transcript_32238/g.75322  ORF Transcript_32238/g.75322 Transcript_32238/m.75322 type:complete len:132 (+) Transcript_32238:154-549(+)
MQGIFISKLQLGKNVFSAKLGLHGGRDMNSVKSTGILTEVQTGGVEKDACCGCQSSVVHSHELGLVGIHHTTWKPPFLLLRLCAQNEISVLVLTVAGNDVRGEIRAVPHSVALRSIPAGSSNALLNFRSCC